MNTEGQGADETWRDYYRRTGFRPPRPTLLRALDAFPAGFAGFAVDLGCGNGRDTVELLRRRWRVLAIDAQAAAIEELRARPGLPHPELLETRVDRFETARWPAADLVNSSFALPLCPPVAFPDVWRRIAGSLRPGGRFAGQLYGDHDEWAADPTIVHHDRAAVDALLSDLAVEWLEEEETDAEIRNGRVKHWHIWHIVVRRP